MVFKTSFTLLVATGTTPFFAVVSIISDHRCINDAECPKRSIGITRCHEKFYKHRFRSHFLLYQIGNDVKSAITEMQLSDWSVLQNLKWRQMSFFLYKRVSKLMRLIPNFPSYRPEVFTISACRNLLHIQLKINRFI